MELGPKSSRAMFGMGVRNFWGDVGVSVGRERRSGDARVAVNDEAFNKHRQPPNHCGVCLHPVSLGRWHAGLEMCRYVLQIGAGWLASRISDGPRVGVTE